MPYYARKIGVFRKWKLRTCTRDPNPKRRFVNRVNGRRLNHSPNASSAYVFAESDSYRREKVLLINRSG